VTAPRTTGPAGAPTRPGHRLAALPTLSRSDDMPATTPATDAPDPSDPRSGIL
jgi:hypothetical protein